ALVGLDVARVVVALHLEDRRLTVTDVYHASVLARSADDPGRQGRQILQVNARTLVREAPARHDGEDTVHAQARLASERHEDALVFFGAEAVLLDDLWGDLGHGTRLSHGGDSSQLVIREWCTPIEVRRAELTATGNPAKPPRWKDKSKRSMA